MGFEDSRFLRGGHIKDWLTQWVVYDRNRSGLAMPMSASDRGFGIGSAS
jgi:hypothetical protein